MADRVLVLDGAMGTMIQRLHLTEEDFRGKRFADHPQKLAGCNDLLVLTRRESIRDIHSAYLEAGADIISTDTFNANAISMADFGLDRIPGLLREINREGTSLAVEAAKSAPARDWGGRALVAGSMGSSTRSATMSPDVNDPAARNVDFDQLYAAYLDQSIGLIEGGADILLFETTFDTLNLKAGLKAAKDAMRQVGCELPIMVSATISDKSGRLLSGQTIEAFVVSVSEYDNVVSIGLNCGAGPDGMCAWIERLGQFSSKYVSAYPNAGFPDELGNYRMMPEEFAERVLPMLEREMLNVVGGCCGTTPEHIRCLARHAANANPHTPAAQRKDLWLSGLDALKIPEDGYLKIVGERCNVAGSRKFLRLIKEKKYQEALAIAAGQVAAGAVMIDVNMDDSMLDAKEEMTHFLRLYASDPDVAKVPVMIDSSDWEVVKAALKNLQGKSIVNSISLKEGEDTFKEKARTIRSLGAGVVVMAFDEKGQADTYARKTEISERAYRLLTQECGFRPEDIIFDVNIMAVATGLKEHDRYGADFIEAVRWIKKNLPGVRTSGGVSNLSFAFRGKNTLREAMHTVFLHHAVEAGLDMAIMNPSAALAYDDIDSALRELIEDVVLARREDAADRLAEYASTMDAETSTGKCAVNSRDTSVPVGDRLRHALVSGQPQYLEEDLAEAMQIMKASEIISGPLMEGMDRVGTLFGEGRMFLPQVVKSARVMRMSVDKLEAALKTESGGEEADKAGKAVIATVKGDVHDIGKNIVAIVLTCNNFEVIDLGVMVEPEIIVETVKKEKPDFVCLSGLITPSLAEMVKTATALKEAGINIPLMVGGATTSDLHTALKIAPVYDGPVVRMADASQNPIAAARLLNPATRDEYATEIKRRQESLRMDYHSPKKRDLIPFEESIIRRSVIDWSAYTPIAPKAEAGNIVRVRFGIRHIKEFINWKMLLHAWDVRNPEGEEAKTLIADARKMMNSLADSGRYDGFGLVRMCRARGTDRSIILDGEEFPMLRQQGADSRFISLCDYISPKEDWVGVFIAGAGKHIDEERKRLEVAGDNYSALLLQSLADRLAEATSEMLHYLVRTEIWGYAPDEDNDVRRILRGEYQGIRPAMGYPCLPDQTLNNQLIDMLRPEADDYVRLTENGAMSPSSTVSGLYIAHRDARYFMTGRIGDDQLSDYASRRGISPERMRMILNH